MLFISYAAVNMVFVFRTSLFKFGPEIAGEYSIYASKNFFIAYHVWGAILAVLCSVSLWRRSNRLFMISLLLFLILAFYPYFTSSPVDKAKAKPGMVVTPNLDAPPTNLDGKGDSTLRDTTSQP